MSKILNINIFFSLLFIFFSVFGIGCFLYVNFYENTNFYDCLLLGICLFPALIFSNHFQIQPNIQVFQILVKLFYFFGIFYILLSALTFLFRTSLEFFIFWIKIFPILFLLLLIILKIYVDYLRKKLLKINSIPTLLIGDSNLTKQIETAIKLNDWLGLSLHVYNVNGNFNIKNFANYIKEKQIQNVLIDLDTFHLSSENEELMRNLAENDLVKFYAYSGLFNHKSILQNYGLIGNYPYIQLFTFPLDNFWNALIKKCFDIIFTTVFFVSIGIWLFPILAILIIIDSGFPIFFIQRRHGIDNKEFYCIKFRTMMKNSKSQTDITIKNDPRITNFGKFLRKSSLDELPQFINVLKGDMSVVGPRPHMINQNSHYKNLLTKYNFRHYVKPGITGLAQVEGFRGEILKDEDMENRLRSDLYYIKNWSFWFDISIIIRTILKFLKGDDKAI